VPHGIVSISRYAIETVVSKVDFCFYYNYLNYISVTSSNRKVMFLQLIIKK